jgi:DNA-binding response OmpR family regulator
MKKTIYLVEDNADIRELIGHLLPRADYELSGFGTAESFKQKMETGLPDLIIMDIMLPDGNGVDICTGLKANTSTKKIPVLLMSAHQLYTSGPGDPIAEDFISKPFDIHDLMGRIQRLTA